jgi:hypothetical protein
VRAQTFYLFGNLSRFGDGPSKAPFLEQIHSNMVSLLLHLNDPEKDVKKVTLYLYSTNLLSQFLKQSSSLILLIFFVIVYFKKNRKVLYK